MDYCSNNYSCFYSGNCEDQLWIKCIPFDYTKNKSKIYFAEKNGFDKDVLIGERVLETDGCLCFTPSEDNLSLSQRIRMKNMGKNNYIQIEKKCINKLNCYDEF